MGGSVRGWRLGAAWVLASAAGFGIAAALAQVALAADQTPVLVAGLLLALAALGTAQGLVLRWTLRVPVYWWTMALALGVVLGLLTSVAAVVTIGGGGEVDPRFRPWPWNNEVALDALTGGGFALGVGGVQAICLRLRRGPAALWLLASGAWGAAVLAGGALAQSIITSSVPTVLVAPAAGALGGVVYGLATVAWVVTFSIARAPSEPAPGAR
jgi:hypothetical protein